MKKSNVIISAIVVILFILNVFLLYFYYSEIAYPIEDPAKFIETDESLKDAAVIKVFNDEYPILSDYQGYLLETNDGNQKLILFCKFSYLDRYQVVWETNVPSSRPCTVTIDFYGKSSDFTLDENNVFQHLEFKDGAFLNVAPNDLMLMPVIGLAVFGGEAAIVYGIYALISKKKVKAVV